MIKTYSSDYEGKEAFVKEVLSPLLIQADTGWYGAEYEAKFNETHQVEREYVWLLSKNGVRNKCVNVYANSLEAIIRDVFRNLYLKQ